MICDNCGQHTDKNYFGDDFTVLCANCAKMAGFYGGADAIKYTKQKATKK